ncbi:beta-N-acetylhexosaminidase [Elioraea rosea]|uniref:beta-N-acetylhexosaminidase n=1 Tax=Elioraea rosea TaxID=2492390 RepID=UPI001950EADB|nr:beta-N-acetylhexosaminidase [Elioraea rosea]
MATGQAPRAAIVGVSGHELTAEEERLFRRLRPLGLIVFARNIDTPAQVFDLTAAFRRAIGREDAPVLIDQEGGRVARLKAPHWRHPPAASVFSRLAATDPAAARRAAFLNARLMADDLADLGIDVDCAPVLDLPVPGAHDVIGDRAHGDTPRMAASLGRAVARGLLAGGVLPVMKHIPGHGRATADSHHALPVVEASLAELRARDARPFAALAETCPWAMTAHIVYRALDPDRPATLSPKVVRFIRREIGFGGVLVTDDLAMKALAGEPGRRAKEAIEAGCDLVLECPGELARTEAVLKAVPELSGTAARRVRAGAKLGAASRTRFERARAEAALAALLG